MLSRVADSLYWMSRYLERADHTARLVDVHLTLMLDQFPESSSRRLHRLLAALCLDDEPEATDIDVHELTRRLTVDGAQTTSIHFCISAGRENARQIRNGISSEMFEQLNRLYHHVKNANFDSILKDGHSDFTSRIIEGSAMFQGLTDSTISHAEGYEFIQMGRHLERALMTIALLNSYSDFYTEPEALEDGNAPTGHLDLVALLKSASAFEAYCREYTATLKKNRILEFLLLDPEFPHSVSFSVAQLFRALNAVSGTSRQAETRPVIREIGRLHSMLTYNDLSEIVENGGITQFLADVRERLEVLQSTIHEVFIAYPIEKELAGGAA